jgi:hypothetical protein
MDVQKQIEQCPRCSSASGVVRKLLLLDKGTLSEGSSQFRPGHSNHGGFTVQGLKPGFMSDGPGAQFIHGLYCVSCGVGFIPESLAKPEAPTYKPFPNGWHRVLPNGELGPLLERIADDPESDVL